MPARVIFYVALVLIASTPAAASAQRRRCMTAVVPGSLPITDKLLDTAAAAAAFGPMTLPSDGMVFSVFYAHGLPPNVHLVEPLKDSIPNAAAQLQRVLFSQDAASPWAIRVRVRPGPAFSLERARFCPPQPITQLVETIRVTVEPDDRWPVAGGRPVRAVIEARLSETGEVLETLVFRSSGIRDLDVEMQRSVGRSRFLPALLDDVPIPSWYRTDGQTLRR